MKKQKIYTRIWIAILAAAFLGIVLGFSICGVYTRHFNENERTATTADPGEYCSFTIAPRGGESDQWAKNAESDNPLYGIVYRATIANYSEYAVDDWTLRINIHEDCYINSNWNGRVEIHQHVATGNELVQTLDLREYSSVHLVLDRVEDDPDLLIPLSEGDYVIYQPSADASEIPIRATAADDEPHTALPGFIFYHDVDDPMVFDDLVFNYTLYMSIQQVPAFWGFVLLSCLWGICVLIFAAVQVTQLRSAARIKQDGVIIEQAINVMAHFVDAKDTYTNGHSTRVAEYSRLLGEKLGMSEEKCRQLYYIALMHDCGKMAVPDSVLKKPGKLTDEEYELIKTHTTRGAELLDGFTSIPGIRDGALYHHERYDGKGYPTGRAGEEIPLVGRIICVADSFDAMDSSRCYRTKRDRDYIVSEITKNRGTQFDPYIADLMLELLDEGKIDV